MAHETPLPYDEPTPPEATTTVNAVDDWGWDPTGQTAITAPVVENGLRVEVPPGEYLWDGANSSVASLTDYAFVGTGTDPDDVTFVSAQGTTSSYFINVNTAGRRVEIGNFTVDWTQRGDTSGICLRIDLDSDYHIHDIRWSGQFPASDTDDEGTPTPTGVTRAWQDKVCQTNVRDPDGVGVVERVDVIADEPFMDGHKGGEGVCIHHQGHEGHAVWRDCHFEGVNGDAPVYAEGLGMSTFERVTAINCAMAGIRTGGDAQVIDCDVIVDHDALSYTGQLFGQNGILWAGQGGEHHGGLIQDCRITVRSRHGGGSAIRHNGTSNAHLTSNTRIEWHESSGTPIFAVEPGTGYGSYAPDPPHHLDFERLTVTGAGDVADVFALPGRADSSIQGLVDLSYNTLVSGLTTTEYSADLSGPGYTDPDADPDPSPPSAEVRAARGHTVELTPPGATPGGPETVTLDEFLGGSIELRHTAISTLDADTPARGSLAGFVLGTATVRYDGRRLFYGILDDDLPGPTTDTTSTLRIRGPAALLDGGNIDISVTNTATHDLIREVWADHTPFLAHVQTPAEPTWLGRGEDEDGNYIPFETSGTALSVLQDLHDRAGMRFAVRFADGEGDIEQPVVDSFVPGESPREPEWARLDHRSTITPGDYANRVTVIGRTPDDPAKEQPRWTAPAHGEIEQYGTYPPPDGLVIHDPELTTPEETRDKARAVLRQRVDEIGVSGEVDIVPRWVAPGYHYRVPAFEPELGGAALPLDRVSIPLLDGSTATLAFAPPPTVADELVAAARDAQRANRLL